MPLFLSHHRPPPPSTTFHHRTPPPLPSCLPNFRPAIHSPLIPFFTIQSRPQQIRRVVICMANPRRVQMVAKQIQREISYMLISDKVLRAAILPEVGFGADLLLSSITTISDVEISNDLQVVKVYVSYFGDEEGKKRAISGLKAKAKYVRAQLGKRMSLRLTPEVRFLEDNSIEEGSKVLAIMDKLEKEEKIARSQASKRKSSDIDEEDEDDDEDEDEDEDEIVEEDDDDNWEDEDPDKGGIIYVE